ncbi:MAG: hypothetical protein NXY57DRAFT_963149 [Lentinula lateritia]|nr:MAG: hypothetical protein NXY57DRAFT_963149 [Lentinula lateritia]
MASLACTLFTRRRKLRPPPKQSIFEKVINDTCLVFSPSESEQIEKPIQRRSSAPHESVVVYYDELRIRPPDISSVLGFAVVQVVGASLTLYLPLSLNCIQPEARLSRNQVYKKEAQPPCPDTEKLKAKEAEVVDLTDRLRYLQADFLNLQRNTAREK